MKKLLLTLFLVLALPMVVLAQDPKLLALEARAVAVGAPTYAEWCLDNNVFWAGYEGFVDFMDNYLTPENRVKVIAAKAYSPSKLGAILPSGSGQNVSEWLKVNPWK